MVRRHTKKVQTTLVFLTLLSFLGWASLSVVPSATAAGCNTNSYSGWYPASYGYTDSFVSYSGATYMCWNYDGSQ